MDPSPFRQPPVEKLFEGVEFLVEATSYEQYTFWDKHAFDSREALPAQQFIKTWEQLPGWIVDVGELAGRPVCIEMMYGKLDGHLICFYHGCSQVVDHEMIEAWLEKNYSLWDTRRCNASNFHSCLAYIRCNPKGKPNAP